MNELESFTIEVKLVTEISQITPLHDGVKMNLDEYSFYDALCSALYRSAQALLAIENKPKKVVLEASGRLEAESEISYLQAYVLYEKFRWEKTGSSIPMFNESGEEPFSIEYNWVKPSLFEKALIDDLSIAFPDFGFRYFDESIQVFIDEKWVDIFRFFRELPESEKLNFDFHSSSGMNDRADRAQRSYTITSTIAHGMKDVLFRSFGKDVEIASLPTFQEIYERTTEFN